MARDIDPLAGADEETNGLRSALRYVAWGGVAASAVAVAMLAARTDGGQQRLARLMSGPASATADSASIQKFNPLAARLAEAEAESQRLADSMRRMSADRDRVLARLDAIERNIDVTASIRDPAPSPAPTPAASPAHPPAPAAPVAQASPPAANPPAPQHIAPAPVPSMPPSASPPTNMAPTPVVSIPIPRAAPPPSAPSAAPAPEAVNPGAIPNPATESTATRTEFGIDVGGDRTVEALRALWTSLRTGRQSILFEGLRPIVSIREGGKPGVVELRLVLGPLVNAGAAARLCGALAAAGLACQPAVFDGQRLALR